MKKRWVHIRLLVLIILSLHNSANAQDPITAVIVQGITRVIKAMDLKIQRLQTKTIWLQNAQKVIENTMSKLKLDEIRDWVEKQRLLYQDYFEELWKVKDILAYYHRIRELTDKQLLLVNEYKRAWRGVRKDPHFTPDEIEYIGSVYTGIIEESLKNLEQVAMVIHSFTTQMTDAKRMEIINQVADAIDQNLSDLNTFNTRTIQLSLARARDAHDIAIIKNLYAIQ